MHLHATVSRTRRKSESAWGLDMALAIDPDHPLTLSCSVIDADNAMADLAEDYGTSCQHTGHEVWYHPWWGRGTNEIGQYYGWCFVFAGFSI